MFEAQQPICGQKPSDFWKSMRNFKDWKSNLLPMNPPSSILGNLIGFASHLHSEASGLWLTGTYVQFIYLINVFCTTHPVLQSSLALGERELRIFCNTLPVLQSSLALRERKLRILFSMEMHWYHVVRLKMQFVQEMQTYSFLLPQELEHFRYVMIE